jgi:hypothetical protein
MRNPCLILSACLAMLAAASGAAHAEEKGNSDDFARRLLAVKPVEQKTYACFVRSYDKAHLAHHPKQTVSDMKLLVAAEKLPEDAALNYSFRLNVKFRNRKGEFASSSTCGHAEMAENKAEDLQIHCGGDCGAAGLGIVLAAGDKAVLLKLDDIVIWPANNPAAADPEVRLNGGADDKVFRLDRVSNDICASLIREDEKEAQEAAAQASN